MLLSLVVRTHARSARLRGCLRAHRQSLYRRGTTPWTAPTRAAPLRGGAKEGPQVHLCSVPRLYVAGIFADSYPLLDTTCASVHGSVPLSGIRFAFQPFGFSGRLLAAGVVDPEGRIWYCTEIKLFGCILFVNIGIKGGFDDCYSVLITWLGCLWLRTFPFIEFYVLFESLIFVFVFINCIDKFSYYNSK